ncbi:ABC transporter substrate-binding protein, partial [Stella sp.]|uniref:ABC transporter substrate-binding protein n=1 Tax=Stella sp. TaxID=2912054 RepID=UPI0035AE3A6D
MTIRSTRPVARLTLLVAAGLAVGCGLPALAQQPKTLRVTMHADVRQLDPFWTTQTIAGIHGMMVYDTLFASDDKLEPKPQMVESWTVSPDRKTYVFTLREGLKFHDG